MKFELSDLNIYMLLYLTTTKKNQVIRRAVRHFDIKKNKTCCKSVINALIQPTLVLK